MIIRMTRTRKNERQNEINTMTDTSDREEAQRSLDACYNVGFSGLEECIPTDPVEYKNWTESKENALIVKRFLKWKNGELSVEGLDALISALEVLGVYVEVCTFDRDAVIDAIVDETYRRHKASQQEG